MPLWWQTQWTIHHIPGIGSYALTIGIDIRIYIYAVYLYMCKSQVITHQAEIGRFDITHFPLPSQISAPENMPFPLAPRNSSRLRKRFANGSQHLKLPGQREWMGMLSGSSFRFVGDVISMLLPCYLQGVMSFVEFVDIDIGWNHMILDDTPWQHLTSCHIMIIQWY